MGLNCGCPVGPSLETITINECKESFGQLQKVIFQRIYATAGTKNAITSNEDKKATYTALFAANDGTKMLISPFIQNPSNEPGEARTFGGGNQTLGGIPIVLGSEPSPFTGIIYQESQVTIAQMKKLQCENIGVYLIDEYGNIACQKISTTAGGQATDSFMPFPISQLFVGDKKLGGFEEPDSNTIRWNFFPNWSDNFHIIKRSALDFDPLSELVNQ